MNIAMSLPQPFHPSMTGGEAERAENEYFDSLCHEIGTPLTAIIGISQLLTSPLTSPQKKGECAEMLRDSTNMLMELIKGKLDLAKIRSGVTELEHVPFDLAKVAEEAVHIMALRAEDKGLALQVHIGKLPEWFMGDTLRVRQIILNLLSNAMKFTETGSVSLEVQAEPAMQGQHLVRISVTDTGIGIEPARLERIFDRFTQANVSIRRRYGGSGLGLSICHQLAQLMQGDISVESQPGKGSRFTATLRLQEAQSTPIAMAA